MEGKRDKSFAEKSAGWGGGAPAKRRGARKDASGSIFYDLHATFVELICVCMYLRDFQ